MAMDAPTLRWPGAGAEQDLVHADLIWSIRWGEADTRDFPIEEREVDLVRVLRILHSLEVPDQMSLLKRCSTMPTLIDTRIANMNLEWRLTARTRER